MPRCRHDPTLFSNEIATVSTSRRRRTARRQLRDASSERLEREQYHQDLAVAEQLGFIDRRPRVTGRHASNNSDREIFQPYIGSYAGPDVEMDVDVEAVDLPSAAHAAYHRMRRYAEIRENISNRWTELELIVTATYLSCQKTYSNWTVFPDAFVLPPNTCTCTETAVHTRKLHLIGITHVVRLVHYGYFACSPDKPRTAFSIPVMQFHHFLWETAVLLTYSFVKALSTFLDSRCKLPLYARGSRHKKRNLRVPFSHSVELYSRVLQLSNSIHTQGLSLSTTDQWASKCPRCFGPREGEVKVDESEPDIIMALDGNFQQRHYAYASKDNPPESKYPHAFIPPSRIVADAVTFAATDSAAEGIDPPCADSHKAANDIRGETTWEKCDDNGLFGSACRHDIPLLFVNIHKTGEKLYYPISILNHVLSVFPQHKVGILYDLGCQLETHVRKRGLLTERVGDLMFGTSVFHAYAHEWSCQVKYNPRLNWWWGLSDGECLERLWAFLSPLISTLRVSTRLHRLTAIQARSDYYTNQLNESAAVWLSQKLKHAKVVHRVSREALEELHAIRDPNTGRQLYTNDFFEQQWRDERNYHVNSSTDERQEVELGRLLSLEIELEQAWATVPMTPEQVVNWANTVDRVQTNLAAQRARVATNGVVDNLPPEQKDKLRILWYLKTELRRAFLSLVEEKQPLLRVCRAGESSTLGTRGQQRVLDALRKRANKLKTVLEAYNTQATEFAASNPNRPAPPTITHTNLLRLQADDTFWNDGLFTNANKPWAIDPHTQDGIRRLASHQRSAEEIRRLGWEARRLMRWATHYHTQHVALLAALNDYITDPDRPANIPPLLDSLVNHPFLVNHRSLDDKLKSCEVIVHAETIHLCTLQLDWNRNIHKVVADTPAQTDDETILELWNVQINRIKLSLAYGFLSGIPGDLASNQIHVLNGGAVEDVPFEDEDPEEEDEDEETYLANIEDILAETMRADLEQENGVVV
ncbi:hypothetical protein PCASD_10249 [Puccinia coronata f. sp. avenae]|uniref:CxC1-like cysteine cluster associated with KDZ transposases domain-containing protein n=1 Tax=Puccinia coronata f. sp. avenae TaxID=200324 RepID=A0A2N5UIH4_9BASI|nr:hypothetical protein PCASD_10249 [Puccinia coronata f. sp. avenae]